MIAELAQRSVVHFVLVATTSLTGEISRLLDGAAALVILDGSEPITLTHLAHGGFR